MTDQKVAHTPGPWEASQPAMGFSDLRQAGAGRLVFALAHPSSTHGDKDISDEEKYANLRLLEAAPELLDVLMYLRNYAYLDLGDHTIRWMDEVIAKATEGA